MLPQQKNHTVSRLGTFLQSCSLEGNDWGACSNYGDHISQGLQNKRNWLLLSCFPCCRKAANKWLKFPFWQPVIGARSLPICPKRSWHKELWRWPQGDNTWMEHKCRSTAIHLILASVYEAPGLFCVIGNWEKSHWHAQKHESRLARSSDLSSWPASRVAGFLQVASRSSETAKGGMGEGWQNQALSIDWNFDNSNLLMLTVWGMSIICNFTLRPWQTLAVNKCFVGSQQSTTLCKVVRFKWSKVARWPTVCIRTLKLQAGVTGGHLQSSAQNRSSKRSLWMKWLG